MVDVIIIDAGNTNITDALHYATENDITVIIDTSSHVNVFSNPHPILADCDTWTLDGFCIQQFQYISPDFDFALPYANPISSPKRRGTSKAFHHFDIDYG